MQKNKAFTLVELIVVITILAVLATVAFISFQWYTISARDAVRLSDVKNIEKSLWRIEVRTWKYPIPEDYVEITSNGTVVNNQWYMWQKTLWTIWVNGWWVDPITWEYYTYVTNQSRTKYQLLSYLEKEENIRSIANLSNIFASDYSDRYLQLSWDKLWVIVDKVTKQPLQTTGTGFDIAWVTSSLEVYISNDEIITGTGVSLWSLVLNSSCKRIQEFDTYAKDGKYMIDPLWDGNEFEALCDMTNDWWGWTLYSGKNIHDLPTKWFLEVFTNKLNINFDKIRWNYRSPLWLELPLIYNLYNQEEWRLLLSSWQSLDANLWENWDLHYKNSINFSNALVFWEKNISWIDINDFRVWIMSHNINYMGAWKNQSLQIYYANMWTAFSWNKSNISKYLWFPSTPYNSTYKIWDETFSWFWSNTHWTDNRSIAIWIK
jgi:prepilin-type N-terminal cleavage/methylation domain-containing protein